MTALAVTEATGPAICATAALVIVILAARDHAASATWGGVAAIFVAVVPTAFVALGVRKGRWSNHHVEDRRARTVPLLVALASVAVGAILLIVSDAPRSLIAVVVAMLVGLGVVLLVSRWWKVSIHCAVAGGFVGVLIVLFGHVWLLGFIALAVLVWSRVFLHAHTWPQAVIGTFTGWVVVICVFGLLR